MYLFVYINEIITTLSVAKTHAGSHFRSSIQHPYHPLVIIARLISLWSHAITVIILVISPGPLLLLSTEN